MIAAWLLAIALVPMHGVVVAPLDPAHAVIRNDVIPATLAAGAHRLRIEPRIILRSGVGIDGFLDRSTTPWTLREAIVAAPFEPGLPNPGRVEIVDIGKPLPHARFVDQRGMPLDLARAFAGKTVLLSFVFTRCPDVNLCPAISGKFAYLQSHLDPKHFALVEITLDPQYDSPAILDAYGNGFGAIPGRWYLLTATGSTMQRVLDQFGINSLRVSTNNFIHNDKLYVVTPQSRVAYIVETAGWDPEGVIAEASAVAGMASNPFERFKLSLMASVVALCGGSQFAGIVLLELSLFTLILVIVAVVLTWTGRLLWGRPAKARRNPQ